MNTIYWEDIKFWSICIAIAGALIASLCFVAYYDHKQDPALQAPAAGTSPTEGGRPGGDGQKGGQPNSRPKSKNANPQKKVV